MAYRKSPEDYRRLAEKCRETARMLSAVDGRANLLAKAEPNMGPERWMAVRAWSKPLPNIGSMDNTGRSEGATAEKAVPVPCAVLDP